MNITVVGAGYVGLASAMLLSQNHEIMIFDIDPIKIDKLSNRISPIHDPEIQDFMNNEKISFSVTMNSKEAYLDADFIILATPTDYDTENNYFDTSSVEKVIHEAILINPNAVIVLKSTVPVGYTEMIKKQFNSQNIVFSPEFLREGSALYDNLYPSRVIVGEKSDRGKEIADLFTKAQIKNDIDVLVLDSFKHHELKF